MKSSLIVLSTIATVCLVVSTCFAQPVDSVWSRTYGVWGTAYSVQQTSDGGYILAGYVSGWWSPPVGSVVKTNATGDSLWTRSLYGCGIKVVQQTTDGGYVLVGTLGRGGGYWLIKTDANGDSVWSRTFGGQSSEDVSSVQQTTDGGYILAGYTYSFGAGNADFWLVKTDANGDSLWSHTFGGALGEYAYSVQQTSDDGYVLSGSTTSFGAGGDDFWLVKTDANGDSLWSHTFGGINSEDGSAVQQTMDGGYILAGYTESFGAGSADFWLVKTDANGDSLWSRTFGGPSSESASSVQQTMDGGYVIAGYTYSFGTGDSDFWLVKADTNGDSLTSRTYGGPGYEYAYSVRQCADSSYVLAGTMDGEFWLVKTGPAGQIRGVVSDENAIPLEGVRVRVDGGWPGILTDAGGQYSMQLSPGMYDLEFSKFGYVTTHVNSVTVAEYDTTWVNVTLDFGSWGVLAGTVITQAGTGMAGASVIVRDTPLDTLITDVQGRFITPLPANSYAFHVASLAGCVPPVYPQLDTLLTVDPGDTTYATISLFVPCVEPTEADAYGYRAYDRYDRDLPAPYDWVEINPDSGGPGMDFAYSHLDSSVYFEAPFPISFYGTSSESLTVNCNGWMLPGIHHELGRNNTPIPSDEWNDPPGIIAPFWDRMRTPIHNAHQISWFDSAGGRWIFEFTGQQLCSPGWYPYNWQVHFLDPAFYPTLAGDCDILYIYGVMQYLGFSTIGIERPDEQTGVQVCYDGAADSTSWPVGNGAAIRFTTGHATDVGTVTGTIMLYPPATPAVALIHIGGRVVSTDADGAFADDSVAAGSASALLTRMSYEPARVSGIPVTPGTPATISFEAWRLDSPRELAATLANGEVTLRWERPASVVLYPNPNVRYCVYRDGAIVSPVLTDTTYVDTALPDTGVVAYTVLACYRFGHSPPTPPLQVQVGQTTGDRDTRLPIVYALKQNYPNPFNPSTTLAYDLPKSGHISLRVFDLLGREVEALKDDMMEAGSHRVTFDGSHLASGIYFARLEAGSFSQTKKLMLLK